MKKRPTRMNIGRKRPRLSEVDQLRAQIVRLRKALKQERANWFEKCPKGHLTRYDKCDIMCYMTNIEALPAGTIVPVINDPLHEWGKMYRSLDKQFVVDKRIGWWWRVPYGWWLAFKNAFGLGMTDDEIAARGIIDGIKERGAL